MNKILQDEYVICDFFNFINPRKIAENYSLYPLNDGLWKKLKIQKNLKASIPPVKKKS